MQYRRNTAQAYDSPAMTSAWIAPDGTWYHVDDCNHEACAAYLGYASAAELESRGWCHLSWTSPYMESYPTDAQADTLLRLADLYDAHARTLTLWMQCEAEESARSIRAYVQDARDSHERAEARRAVQRAYYHALRAGVRREVGQYRREGD
jgi:hypothetical protein